jgi:hypothetical protein
MSFEQIVGRSKRRLTVSFKGKSVVGYSRDTTPILLLHTILNVLNIGFCFSLCIDRNLRLLTGKEINECCTL